MILFAAGVAAGVAAAARDGRDSHDRRPTRPSLDLRRLLWGELMVALGVVHARFRHRMQPR